MDRVTRQSTCCFVCKYLFEISALLRSNSQMVGGKKEEISFKLLLLTLFLLAASEYCYYVARVLSRLSYILQ